MRELMDELDVAIRDVLVLEAATIEVPSDLASRTVAAADGAGDSTRGAGRRLAAVVDRGLCRGRSRHSSPADSCSRVTTRPTQRFGQSRVGKIRSGELRTGDTAFDSFGTTRAPAPLAALLPVPRWAPRPYPRRLPSRGPPTSPCRSTAASSPASGAKPTRSLPVTVDSSWTRPRRRSAASWRRGTSRHVFPSATSMSSCATYANSAPRFA